MSYDIELPSDKAAPLPWYPPFCKAYDGVIPKYDKLKTIAHWTFISTRKAEKEIESAYHFHSPEKNFHEWGSRVNEAMKRVITEHDRTF